MCFKWYYLGMVRAVDKIFSMEYEKDIVFTNDSGWVLHVIFEGTENQCSRKIDELTTLFSEEYFYGRV